MVVIVLFLITGELGVGKTLALTYLAWHNWFNKKRRIYANYNLYGIPFVPIKSIDDIDKMKEGFFAGDEFWLWCDARTSRTERNRVISGILLKSRKRSLTICFTAQAIHLVDKRIRDVLDFVAYPLMSVADEYCRLEIFRGSKPSIFTRMKPPIYFSCEKVYALYNTYEEVGMVEEKSNSKGEIFIPIIKNEAWIRYLTEVKGLKSTSEIEKYSERIMNLINPQRIKSGVPK